MMFKNKIIKSILKWVFKMKRTILFCLIISQVLFGVILPFILRLSLFLNPIALVVVWGSWTGAITFFICLFRRQKIILSKGIVMGIMLVYSLCLLILLFFRPGNQHYNQWNLTPFKTILFYFSNSVEFLVAFYNLAANIGLFIPYGLFLLLFSEKRSFSRLTVIPVLSISLIEVMQFLTHRGSLDIDDLILNTLGVGIGYILYPVFKRVIEIKPKRIT